jgi:hypothetical protein
MFYRQQFGASSERITLYKRRDDSFVFLNRFNSHKAYTVCTKINYKTDPVTNLNKYLHYGTSGTEHVHKHRCKYRQ